MTTETRAGKLLAEVADPKKKADMERWETELKQLQATKKEGADEVARRARIRALTMWLSKARHGDAHKEQADYGN